MRTLWLWFLPLLFLPNFVFAQQTAYGELEISDFLIGPYILAALLAPGDLRRAPARELAIPALGFLLWATLATATVSLRYGYGSMYFETFGLLKLGKFSLYVVAGVVTIRALTRLADPDTYRWSMAGATLLASTSMLWLQARAEIVGAWVEGPEGGYKSNNAAAVLLAILVAYVGAAWLGGRGSTLQRQVLLGAGIAGLVGILVSNGRGGWFAVFGAAVYLGVRFASSLRTMLAVAGGSVVVVLAYIFLPLFRFDVSRTFLSDDEAGVSVDDGGRMTILANSIVRLLDDPIFGRGIFHRGSRSGIYTTGSHNHFLQMFLETGLVGGVLFVAIFWVMARQSMRLPRPDERAMLQAALIAAVIGGLGGEYFYGGVILLGLMFVYAPTGAGVTEGAVAPVVSPSLRRLDGVSQVDDLRRGRRPSLRALVREGRDRRRAI